MAEALAAAFAAGRAEGRALVMPFLVCGYPDAETFPAVAAAAADGGADVLEIGIPFSDPVMDGPVIQEAATRVLERGQTVRAALDLAGRAARAAALPAVLMTYYNPIFHAGLESFAGACTAAGAAGVIVPDLSIEESGPWRSACRAAGLATVFMAAPTSVERRLRLIAEASEGFIYAASTLGVTGVREDLSRRASGLVERIRECTRTPVAVGIGVSTPEHAREVASYADGVIVGSALVRRLGQSSDPATETREFVAALRAAVTGA
ncbi:MAG: tryptophan synthase subunit alpha [Acidobacteria bacterium]|nr:tryptophan synthase subunit alpha [Acidobacteriota bacterium]